GPDAHCGLIVRVVADVEIEARIDRERNKPACPRDVAEGDKEKRDRDSSRKWRELRSKPKEERCVGAHDKHDSHGSCKEQDISPSGGCNAGKQSAEQPPRG